MAALDCSSKQPDEWSPSNGTTGTTTNCRQVICPAWSQGVRVHSIDDGGTAVDLVVSDTGTDDGAIGSETVEVPANNVLPIYRSPVSSGSWSIYIADATGTGSAAFAVDFLHRVV